MVAGQKAGVGTTAEDAFRRLYAQNFGAIRNYALRRVRRAEDATDLVAETFLVAWRRWAEVPAGDEALLWLYGVARLVLANHQRGERRRHQLGWRLQRELRDHLTTPDPTSELVEVQAVEAALAALPPADREVLELTVWEQLAPREIAVALGLSPDVVRARLSRARTRMRSQLDHDPGRGGHQADVRTVSVPKEGMA
jgi:RNA polymerase sigma-70 factor (ECF subfamily)